MTARLTLARCIASGLGSGYAPRAPGTAGSLLALLLGALLLRLSPWALPLAVLAATFGGVWAIRRALGETAADADPGWVVIDEFAGQWIALLVVPPGSWRGLLAAFVLFRALDILKPGPVGWADRQHGAVGIMADDVIAGAIAMAALWLAGYFLPGLLAP